LNTRLNISDTYNVAYYTIISFFRKKVIYLFFAAIIILMLFSSGLSGINIGAKYRLFENILINAEYFFLHLFALIISIDLIRKEEISCIYMLPLSTGISRKSYYLGRFSGISIILLISTLGIVILNIVLVYFIEKMFPIFLLQQLLLILFSIYLFVGLFFLFSVFVGPNSATVYTVLIWMIGNSLDEFYIYAQTHQKFVLLSKWLYYVFPNFSLYDIVSYSINYRFISAGDVGFRLIYTLAYLVILLFFAVNKYSGKVLSCKE
jgi:ABC-type transport system involved in multi-copper enzyme maturation permease subunit